MRLSEAIMLGSTLSKQGFGPEALHEVDRCAIGAALQALNITVTPGNTCFGYLAMNEAYPDLRNMERKCPAGKCQIPLERGTKVLGVIWHLNDIHKWSRERIAEWVASIEPPEPIEKLREQADEILSAYIPQGWTKERWIRAMAEHRSEGE